MRLITEPQGVHPIDGGVNEEEIEAARRYATNLELRAESIEKLNEALA